MTTTLHPFGPFVRRFLLDEGVADRHLSLNTQLRDRDSLRWLFGFLAERHGAPAQVMTEQITAELVRDFLAHLESQRGNSGATRNQRLAAIHSIFRFIGRQAAELVEHATSLHAIPPPPPEMQHGRMPRRRCLLSRRMLADFRYRKVHFD